MENEASFARPDTTGVDRQHQSFSFSCALAVVVLLPALPLHRRDPVRRWLDREHKKVASFMDGRTSKQCRERWCHHLDPAVRKGGYTTEEDELIIFLQVGPIET